MPRRRLGLQFASRCRQSVGENEGKLLWQPERCLITAPPVVKGNDPAGNLAAGLDPLQLVFGDVVTQKEPWAERTGMIAVHEQIDMPNMIGLENDRSRRACVEALPHLGCWSRRPAD